MINFGSDQPGLVRAIHQLFSAVFIKTDRHAEKLTELESRIEALEESQNDTH